MRIQFIILSCLGALVAARKQKALNTGIPCARGTGVVNDKAKLYKIVPGKTANYTLCLRTDEYVDQTIRKSGKWVDCDPYIQWGDKAGGIFLDVGTNIGACSLPMLALGHKVISFEPTKTTFAALSAAVKATLAMDEGREQRGTITLVNKGASDKPGTSIIYSRPGNSGDSVTPGATDLMEAASQVNKTVSAKLMKGFWDENSGYLSKPTRAGFKDKYVKSSIELTTLDDVVNEPVDFLKIDAQGHEIKVLLGATNVLRKYSPRKIMFEWNPEAHVKFGHGATDILEILHAHGYRIYPGRSLKALKKPIDPWKFKSMARYRAIGDDADFIAIKNGIPDPWPDPTLTIQQHKADLKELKKKKSSSVPPKANKKESTSGGGFFKKILGTKG